MGKGDKKTRKGKIIMGSYGKKRPRKVEKSIVITEKPKKAKVEKEEASAAKIVAKKAPVKKAVVKVTTAPKAAKSGDASIK